MRYTWIDEYLLSKKKQQEILASSASANTLSCCGAKCTECEFYGTMCKGCNASLGKVFHAPNNQACPIYECSINRKGMKGCGECAHVPCELWRKTKDPAFTEEEFEQNIQERIERLTKENQNEHCTYI